MIKSVCWHSTTDGKITRWFACVDTADDVSTSDKNFVDFGPVTPEFFQACLCQMAHMLGFARHF